MNTLVVCTNRYRHPAPVVPLGACLVADAAERAGHRAMVCDLMFARHPQNALAEALERCRPDVVGLSVRNIDNNDMRKPLALYEELTPLMGIIRSRTDSPVVLGGAAVAVMPDALLQHTGADWAAAGDGETTFPALLEALALGKSVRAVPGLSWRAEHGVERSPAPARSASDICRPVDLSRWLDLKAYRAQRVSVPVQTKRGCPFPCVYCTYSAAEGPAYRLSPPAAVAASVQALTAAGCRDVEFVDNVFNAPYGHALAICEELAARKHRARLQSVELNPRFVDDKLLDAMERAGFVGVGITAESASDGVAAAAEGVYEGRPAADGLRRAAAPAAVSLDLLFGGPGETEATMRETLAFAGNEVRPADAVFYNRGLRIYPGTELERIARAEGVLTVPPSEMLQPVFYLSPEVDAACLDETLDRFRREHLNCINVDAIGLSFLPALTRLLSTMGLQPPLWKHTRSLRRMLRVFDRSL